MISIDLSGKWHVLMGERKSEIVLPDSLSNAKIPEKSNEKSESYLTDEYPYEGEAVFSREVDIPDDLTGKLVSIFVERTRISTLIIDGVTYDTQDSLCAPHEHFIEGGLSKGKHQLAVKVSNTGYKTKGGHMTSPDTQTNWLGMLGRIDLNIREKLCPGNVQIYTEVISQESAKVKVTASTEPYVRTLVRIIGCGFEMQGITESDKDGSVVFETVINNKTLLWDEYNRNLFKAEVSVPNGEMVVKYFGIRSLRAESLKLFVNDREVFLRGKHDGMIFPLTGYAPMDKESWVKVLSTAREYGINHYRFHTCCPPEAAFEAADEVGIYMEPELPFWGTVADEGEEGFNKEEQEFLISEGIKILDSYGNHPSFFMMSMGNELWGSHKRIAHFLKLLKEHDGRHLYTGGSNNFQFVPVTQENEDVMVGVRFSSDRLYRGSYAMCDAPLGMVQTSAPSTDVDYDAVIAPEKLSGTEGPDGYIEIQYGTGVKKVKAGENNEILKPAVPVISHEVGQYYFYPDFDEAAMYTGPLKPYYLDKYREKAEKNGLYSRWKTFFNATGRLAADCYKREIEALISSRNLSGFQLLDLQDFTGQSVALVGVLNALMLNKGIISSEEFREFCNDNCIFGRMKKQVYKEGDSLALGLMLCTDRPYEFKADHVDIKLIRKKDEQVVCQLRQKLPVLSERVNNIGDVVIAIPVTGESCEYELRLVAGDVINHYPVYAFTDMDVKIGRDSISYNGNTVSIVSSVEEAVKLKINGKVAVVIPEKTDEDLPGTYCTDFWNYPMFSSISRSIGRPEPIGTLGIAVCENHPIFNHFPATSYASPQWYELIVHSTFKKLSDEQQAKHIAEPIDNPYRAMQLGFIYEENGVLVCTARLYEKPECVEFKALAADIVEYLNI